MDCSLVQNLREQIRLGEPQAVAHATAEDLGDFQVEQNQCHPNVDRWCLLHPGHRRVRGWLITGNSILDKHSVVDRGPAGLLDITPMRDRSVSIFLVHDGSPTDFDALQSQVILCDLA